MPDNARSWAVKALTRFYRDKSYSNILLEEELQKCALPQQDKALATTLFYGVIERQLTLDYLISCFCKMNIKRLHPIVLNILRVGAYQLIAMDKIPASAAVNEMVTLAKRMGQARASGMINAVLRAMDREGRQRLDALPDTPTGWEKRYSCPQALLSIWESGYGRERTRALAKQCNSHPAVYLRVNTLVTTTEKLAEELDKIGVSYRKVEGLPNCLEILQNSYRKKLEKLPKNWYYHQDIASQWSCLALGAQPGEKIADVCAAPGGKSFTVAQYMQNQGELYSCDIYAAKCDVIRRRAAELTATVIEVHERDASQPCAPQEKGAFDRVLCDVPCSGLGVIRRKPEIRYKDTTAWEQLPAIQWRILEASAAMVRSGGVLQYSTCTLRPEENEQIASRFLAEHPDFSPRVLPLDVCFGRAGLEPSHMITLFPDEQGSDGFFIAGFVRE